MASTPGFLARQAGGLMRARTLTAGANLAVTNGDGSDNPTIALVQSPLDLTGGQIKFPGTQSSSANANTLDDYERGTWTPSDQSGASLSFTASGEYIKIGRLVWVKCIVIFPATASGASVKIGGLPFTANSVNGGGGSLTTMYTNSAHPNGVMGYVRESSTNIELFNYAPGTEINSAFSGTYYIAAGCYEATA